MGGDSGKIKSSGRWRSVESLDELREHPRFRVRGRVDIHGEERWPDHAITNLSVGGICVTVPSPSPVGARVKLVLKGAEDIDPVEVEGEVKWSSSVQMGLEFTCGPSQPEVLRYLNATRIEVVPDERDR